MRQLRFQRSAISRQPAWMATALVWIVAGLVCGQTPQDANRRYQTPDGREGMAKSLNRPGRDAEQKPKQLVKELDLKPGMTVADIGTGAGYMIPYLSEAVGASGQVLAEDIFKDLLGKAESRAREAKVENARFVLGTDRDPKLPAASLDVAFSLDAYHHFEQVGEMLAGIRSALKDNGRLVIVDYYKRPEAMAGGNAVQHIHLDKDDVVKEIESNGFHLIRSQDHIPGKQYMVVFEKK